MRIQSKYHDVIDYLQDFTDDRIFIREEFFTCGHIIDYHTTPLTWYFDQKVTGKPTNYYFIPAHGEQDIHGTFHFLPTDLKLKITLEVKNDKIIIKPRDIHDKRSERDFQSFTKDFQYRLNNYFNGCCISDNYKVSKKPICYITFSYSGWWTCVWVNPPICMFNELLNNFNSVEELYQEIETYLWSDVELKDPMKNIGNDDRIIGHGFDLKSSFRKEKKND